MYYQKYNKIIIIFIIIIILLLLYNYNLYNNNIESFNCNVKSCNNNLLIDINKKYCYILSYIKHINSDLYLVNNSQDKTLLYYTDDINSANIWKFVKMPNNYYKIISINTEYALSYKNNQFCIDILNNTDDQLWKINIKSNDKFNIVLKSNNNKTIEVGKTSTYIQNLDVNNIDQNWYIPFLSTNIKSCSNSQYLNIKYNECIDLCYIKNYNNKKYIFNDSNNNISLIDIDTNAKMWKFIPYNYGYYKIVSNINNYVLESSDGINVTLNVNKNENDENQYWVIVWFNDFNYTICWRNDIFKLLYIDNNNLKIYKESIYNMFLDKYLWILPTFYTIKTNSINSGPNKNLIYKNFILFSNNMKYKLDFSDINNGNFIIYKYSNNSWSSIWNSNTINNDIKFGSIQYDGNFVLYNNGSLQWYAKSDT